jgi:hypothetical protein
MAGLTYRHWMLTDGRTVFEFGGPDLSIYNARVIIHTLVPSAYTVEKTAKVTPAMLTRMGHVLGMRSYSLCFRNCEHVANYVFRGRWYSGQLIDDGRGAIMTYFQSYMLDRHRALLNTHPEGLRQAHHFALGDGHIYPFAPRPYAFSSVSYYLDAAESTTNFLVIGPTTAGKSRLINVFFNRPCCDEGQTLQSVTRDIVFLRGEASFVVPRADGRSQVVTQKVVLADTVGLCDSAWDEAEVIRLIKHRVSSNLPKIHGVMVLIPTGTSRLSREAREGISTLLRWLQFDTHRDAFVFLLTKTDLLNEPREETLAAITADVQAAFDVKPVPRVQADRSVALELPIYPCELPPLTAIQKRTADEQTAFQEGLKKTIWRGSTGNGEIDLQASARMCAIM